MSELPGVRARLRAYLRDTCADGAGRPAPDEDAVADAVDRVVLAFDEMASNALRHGGGGVRAAVTLSGGAWLIEVRDRSPGRAPTPAVGRDPSQGGLGLYLIAELATEHGWEVRDGQKSVWAVLDRPGS